jgi:hypothetical protein
MASSKAPTRIKSQFGACATASPTLPNATTARINAMHLSCRPAAAGWRTEVSRRGEESRGGAQAKNCTGS